MRLPKNTRTSPAGRGAPRRRRRQFNPQEVIKYPYKHSKTTRIDYQDFTLKWISGQEKLCVRPQDSSSRKIHRGRSHVKTWIIALQHPFQKIKNTRTCNSISVRGNLDPKRHTKVYIYIPVTPAFLEGVIWQLTVSAPSAR